MNKKIKLSTKIGTGAFVLIGVIGLLVGIYLHCKYAKFEEIFSIKRPTTRAQKMIAQPRVDRIVNEKWAARNAAEQKLNELKLKIQSITEIRDDDPHRLPKITERDVTIAEYFQAEKEYEDTWKVHAVAYKSAYDAGLIEGREPREEKKPRPENHLVVNE